MASDIPSKSPFLAESSEPSAPHESGRYERGYAAGGGPGDPGGPNDPDPKWGRIALTASAVVFLFSLLFSTVLQGGGLAYLLHFVPPPARDASQLYLAERFVQFRMEEEEEIVEEEPEEEVIEEEPDENIPAPPPPEPEPEAIEEPPPEEEPPPPPEPEVQEQPQETGFAVETYGAEGGGGPSIRTGGARLGEEIADEPQAPETRQERREERREERQARERRGPVRMEDTSTPPQIRSQSPALGYPRELRDRGIQGRVVVQCIITEQGRVVACRHRSGPQELAQYSMGIVQQWRFSPGLDHNNQPVPVVYTFQFPFRLRTD